MKLLITVLFAATNFSLGYSSNLWATENYQYEKDLSFFTVLFMDSNLPLSNHPQTNQYCGGDCHWLYPAGLLPGRSWESILSRLNKHYGEKVIIPEEDLQLIKSYLVSNSAEITESSTSVKILDGIKEDQTPLSVYESSFIKRKHKKISPEVFKRTAIKNNTNCPACHIDVKLTGSFSEDDVEIPD